MLKPEDHITRKKPGKKKSPVKVRDLVPRKGPRGGGSLYPSDPPLPIPPRGFITETDETKDRK